jgi:glycosyltransferase involved in cell wall biosynthesis
MVETINSASLGFSASFFVADDLPATSRVLEVTDILVLCRVTYSDKINRLIMQARAYGCKIIFDVDDLIFDLDYAPLVLDTLDKNFDEHMTNVYYAYIARIGAVLKMCDETIVTNERLAERFRHFKAGAVHVLPNFLNRSQLRVSKQLYEQKCANNFTRDKNIHLGYFSGSPTHNRDFALISNVLIKLLQEDSRLVLRLGGYLEVPQMKPVENRIERFPLQDFLNLQLLQASTEINLVPLQNNIFTDCKSDLKYFEAGIVGTISIASPAFVFRNSIKDGRNGYLATEPEWETKIREVIELTSSSYKDVAEKAFQDCQKRYSSENQIAILESVFNS